ncbi:epoxide hydrolase, soluble (sEH) [Coelomomyces lativittatus]|nr:epoxide hydrolase, soluble (sEH) [Coelomomyces lativittatus]
MPPALLPPFNGILETPHTDLIHDICYNFHGTLLATCSSDHHCTIFTTEHDGKGKTEHQEEETQGEYPRSSSSSSSSSALVMMEYFKAHDASVLRILFAAPEFGHVLATCSMDRTVRIWELGTVKLPPPSSSSSSSTSSSQPLLGGGGGSSKWIEKARLTESRSAVMDIDFAPATCSLDGYVRIYEALDPVHLSQWSLVDELHVGARSGGGGGGGGESMETWTVAWCPSKYTVSWTLMDSSWVHPSAMFVVAGAFPPKVYYSWANVWACFQAPGGCDAVTVDVAWAPSMGRSYHLIATASKDGLLRVLKLQGQEFSLLTVLAEHTLDVYRLHWNFLGSMLASTSKDGSVRIWKSFPQPDSSLVWKCVRVIEIGS